MNPSRIISIYRMKMFRRIHPTGSRYICDPPVMDTDEDFVCLLPNGAELDDYNLHDKMVEFGFNRGSIKYGTRPRFHSFRKTDLNLIVTDHEPFYNIFVKATEEAKKLNILDKQKRVDFFDKIMYPVEQESRWMAPNGQPYGTIDVPIPETDQVLQPRVPRRRTRLRPEGPR